MIADADGSHHDTIDPSMTTRLLPVGDSLGNLTNLGGGSVVANSVVMMMPLTRSDESGSFKWVEHCGMKLININYKEQNLNLIRRFME